MKGILFFLLLGLGGLAAEYTNEVAAIELRRAAMARTYAAAESAPARARILAAAGRQLTAAVSERLAPHWLGTGWAYSGTSQVPQQGKIACGYYVSTLLRDAGLKVERVRLAQQASEHIVKSLVDEAHIRRFRRTGLAAFVTDLKQQGDGLYVVGLDYHVGLIRVSPDGVRFLHSTVLGDGVVIDEAAMQSEALEQSAYRITGKLSADRKTLQRWLRGEAVPTTASR